MREHVTTEEAAEYLGVSPSWQVQSRGRGDGPPYVKIGRAVRYAKTALDAWVQSRTMSSTSQTNSSRQPRE
jgi:predicted DNA-binding transcriptional regulator AlpA